MTDNNKTLSEDDAYDVDEPESDESMTEDNADTERSFVAPQLLLDDVHEQAYTELEDAGVNVEQALAERLHQTFESELYQLRQEFKYGGGRQ